MGKFHEKRKKKILAQKKISSKIPQKKVKVHFCHFEKSFSHFQKFFFFILKKKFFSRKFVFIFFWLQKIFFFPQNSCPPFF